jgi:hypothetical protein
MRRSPSLLTLRVGLCVAVLGLFGLACAQTDMTGPEQPALEQPNYLSIAPGFLKCRPLGSVSVAKAVSPGVWDTVKVGPHKLIFQPGSLSQRTIITASFSNDSSRSIKFGPEGLQFKSGYAPTLVMSVGNCGALASTMKIVYSDDYLSTVKETKTSVVNLSLLSVSAAISHFSRYAVHY